MERKWINFRGKETTLESIDHQYLSNIYWFHLIVCEYSPFNELLRYIKDVLSDRFNGQLLPYKPHIKFEYEIDYLNSKGLLVWNTDKTYAQIIYNSKVVGEIIKPL